MERKTCTGERYTGEWQSLSALPKWHGKFGHLNAYRLDHEDPCTGFGRHDRVVAFVPDAEGLYCRVDHVWSLGMPTERQILAVAKHDNGTRGKWRLDRIEPWDNGKSTDCHFVRVT